MGTGRGDGRWEIDAMTFDVDATLYNYPRMMVPRLHRWGRHVRLLGHLTKARQRIRREGPQEDFRRRQAEIVAELSGMTVDDAYARIERVLYNGWNVDFRTVKPYRGAHEFVRRAVENGVRIAIISDYPPMKKLEYMGFLGYPWAAIVECEAMGLLKPAPRAFEAALDALGLTGHPERAIHIGDNYNYDVKGAKAVGMRAAWLRRRWRFTAMPWGEEDKERVIAPDIIFKDWRVLSGVIAERCGWSGRGARS